MPRERIKNYRIRALDLRAVAYNATSETARKHLESRAGLTSMNKWLLDSKPLFRPFHLTPIQTSQKPDRRLLPEQNCGSGLYNH
jgi:hypothetical protein